jgi:hypothetical protein
VPVFSVPVFSVLVFSVPVFSVPVFSKSEFSIVLSFNITLLNKKVYCSIRL